MILSSNRSDKGLASTSTEGDKQKTISRVGDNPLSDLFEDFRDTKI